MAPQQEVTNSRLYPRLQIRIPFPCSFTQPGGQCSWEGGRDGLGVVFDISGRGAKVLSETIPLHGDQITATFRFPWQTSPTRIDVARVRWKGAHTFGLEFTMVSESAKMRIHQFMAHSLNDRTKAMKELARMVPVDKGTAVFGPQYLDRGKLDYSLDSLKYVDRFLDQIRRHEDLLDVWSDVVIRVGAYLGEVIRRHSTKHAWYWIDYESAKTLDPVACEAIGAVIGSTTVLFSGKREFALPLMHVEKRLRQVGEKDLLDFAKTILSLR